MDELSTLGLFKRNIVINETINITYDHRLRKTGHPVRSAIHKPEIG